MDVCLKVPNIILNLLSSLNRSNVLLGLILINFDELQKKHNKIFDLYNYKDIDKFNKTIKITFNPKHKTVKIECKLFKFDCLYIINNKNMESYLYIYNKFLYKKLLKYNGTYFL